MAYRTMGKEKMNLRLFGRLRECGRAYRLEGYGLKRGNGGESSFAVVARALDAAVKAYVEGMEKEETKERASEEMKLYPMQEDGFKRGAEADRESSQKKLDRLVDYLYGIGLADGAEKHAKVWYSFPLFIKNAGEELEAEISDVSDLVLVEGENVRAIKFSFGTSPYSSRARKSENFPANAVALSAMSVGLSQLFQGKCLTCEEWFFDGKDDKNDVFPDFEYRPEKNIVRYSYKDGEAEQVIQKLAVAGDEGNCKGCRYCRLCEGIHVREEDFHEHISKNLEEPVFTESQKKVVMHKDGPMSVLAVPGAGKTTVLVHRLAELVKGGVRAENILFVTFTKKARAEIEGRVRALLGENAEMPAINTFHAFAFSVLKENPMLFGSRPKMAEDTDCKKIIRECLDELPPISGVSYRGAYLEGFGLFERMLGWFKELDRDGEEAFQMGHAKLDCDGIVTAYRSYKGKMKQRGCLTYDEQIAEVNKLFRKYPKFLKQVAEQYRYIMVDEFQDTSEDQAEMIYSIARQHGNIVVVGDDDQSIYGWRGGTNQFLMDFGKNFDGAETVVMNDNFRSNNNILSAADTVIIRNNDRIRKGLVGHREAKFKPAYYRNADAGQLASLVSQLTTRYSAGDIAVIARKNKGIAEAETALKGIAETSSPGEIMLDDGVFRLVHAMTSLYVNGSADECSLYLLLSYLAGEGNIPLKGRGQSLFDAVHEREPAFTLDRLDTGALAKYGSATQTPLVVAGVKILRGLKKMQYFRGFGKLFQDFSDIFGIPSGHPTFRKLAEDADLRGIARLAELHEYLSDMVLFRDARSVEHGHAEDEVTLITAHASKGMEFPVVIIYDVGEFDLSPEGKRLLYVAMTRAKNTLLILEKPYPETKELLTYFGDRVMVRQ